MLRDYNWNKGLNQFGLVDLSNITYTYSSWYVVRWIPGTYSNTPIIRGHVKSPNYGNKWLCLWNFNLVWSRWYGDSDKDIQYLNYSLSILKFKIANPDETLTYIEGAANQHHWPSTKAAQCICIAIK